MWSWGEARVQRPRLASPSHAQGTPEWAVGPRPTTVQTWLRVKQEGLRTLREGAARTTTRGGGISAAACQQRISPLRADREGEGTRGKKTAMQMPGWCSEPLLAWGHGSFRKRRREVWRESGRITERRPLRSPEAGRAAAVQGPAGVGVREVVRGYVWRTFQKDRVKAGGGDPGDKEA